MLPHNLTNWEVTKRGDIVNIALEKSVSRLHIGQHLVRVALPLAELQWIYFHPAPSAVDGGRRRKRRHQGLAAKQLCELH